MATDQSAIVTPVMIVAMATGMVRVMCIIRVLTWSGPVLQRCKDTWWMLLLRKSVTHSYTVFGNAKFYYLIILLKYNYKKGVAAEIWMPFVRMVLKTFAITNGL